MTSVLAVGGMVRCHNSQCLMPAGARIGYFSSYLDKIIITSSYLYIWVERDTVKEISLFYDDIAMPWYPGALDSKSRPLTIVLCARQLPLSYRI